jgi:tripartite-type tricarboxylate transporter receptor subunit TctC
MRAITRGLAAVLFAVLCTGAAFAQNYPSRPIRIILPVGPGGGLDIVARLISPKMGQSLGQTVVVDNRPGASGAIALEIASHATPDGYSVMVFSSSQVIFSSLNKTNYDLFRDFIPVSQVTAAPYVLMVSPQLPAGSVKELVAHAKTNPGKLNYASAGNASLQHLATEYFATIAGVKFTHIPYKGIGTAVPDLVSGRTHMTISSVTSMVPHVRSKRLRALAVTSAQRTPVLPGVVTMIEAGVPGFLVTQWLGAMVPAGTPKRIVDLLQSEIVKALGHADVAAALALDGTTAVGSAPDAFAQFMRAERDKWVKVAREAGIPAGR